MDQSQVCTYCGQNEVVESSGPVINEFGLMILFILNFQIDLYLMIALRIYQLTTCTESIQYNEPKGGSIDCISIIII